jgi:Zn-dependent protease with chaperone function
MMCKIPSSLLNKNQVAFSINSKVTDTAQPKQPVPAAISFPWLWFWLVVYIFSVPAVFQNFLLPYVTNIVAGDAKSTVRPFFTELSTRGVSVVELVPYVIVLLGVISLFFPKQRAARLEKKYRLKDIAPGQLPEIRAFMECHAPNINIKVNLAKMNEYAFVYPTGYRSFAIAIFGPFALLWRRDPDAAKAVLLHEIAHYRSGDGHVQGTGSLFTTYLKSWFLIFAVSMILPFILNLLSAYADALSDAFSMDLPILELLLDLIIIFFTTFIPGLIHTLIAVFLATISIIFMPLMGIWIAEVNADFYAIQILGDANAVQRALHYVGYRFYFFIWLLRRMTHPPEVIRRAVISVQNRNLMLTIILMLMPLAFLTRIIIALINLIVVMIGASGLNLITIMFNLGVAMTDLSSVLIFAVFSLFIWPWLAPRWQLIFTNSRETPIAQKIPYFVASGVTLAFVFFLALVGGSLKVIFQ